MVDDPWIVCFNIRENPVVSLSSRGDVDRDTLEVRLYYLNLFLEAGDGWDVDAYDSLTLLS